MRISEALTRSSLVRVNRGTEQLVSGHAIDAAIQAIGEGVERVEARPAIDGGKTGWPAGMLQDDNRPLSRWLANRIDSRMHAREAAEAIKRDAEAACPADVLTPEELDYVDPVQALRRIGGI